MKKKIFKFKLINGDDSVILTLDYSDLSTDNIHNIITKHIGESTTNNGSSLIIVGKRSCKLELEDVHNLVVLFQSVFIKNIIWLIVDKPLEESDPEDLDGYFSASTEIPHFKE